MFLGVGSFSLVCIFLLNMNIMLFTHLLMTADYQTINIHVSNGLWTLNIRACYEWVSAGTQYEQLPFSMSAAVAMAQFGSCHFPCIKGKELLFPATGKVFVCCHMQIGCSLLLLSCLSCTIQWCYCFLLASGCLKKGLDKANTLNLTS